MHHGRGLAASGVMLLQRACLSRAALGRLPREVALNTVCSQRLGGFLDDLCREGFLEQIIRLIGACRIVGVWSGELTNVTPSLGSYTLRRWSKPATGVQLGREAAQSCVRNYV